LITTCLLMAAPAAAKPTLVVAPLQSAKRDKDNADTLGEMIRIQVGKSDRYTLVTPEDMGAIDEELKRQLSGGCDEASCIADLGGALGAQFMITGKLKRMGKRYILLLKLVDIEKVKAINTQSVMAAGPEVLLDLLESKVAVLLGSDVVRMRTVRRKSPTAQGAEITAELGWLSISGKPVGVSVSLSGPSGYQKVLQLPMGKPWIEQLPPGTYLWSAKASGYEQENGQVKVNVDKTTSVNIGLKRPGSLRIVGAPKGAKVTVTGVNNFRLVRGLPVEIQSMPRGRYKVEISRKGYQTKLVQHSVRSGSKGLINVDLKRSEQAPDWASARLTSIRVAPKSVVWAKWTADQNMISSYHRDQSIFIWRIDNPEDGQKAGWRQEVTQSRAANIVQYQGLGENESVSAHWDRKVLVLYIHRGTQLLRIVPPYVGNKLVFSGGMPRYTKIRTHQTGNILNLSAKPDRVQRYEIPGMHFQRGKSETNKLSIDARAHSLIVKTQPLLFANTVEDLKGKKYLGMITSDGLVTWRNLSDRNVERTLNLKPVHKRVVNLNKKDSFNLDYASWSPNGLHILARINGELRVYQAHPPHEYSVLNVPLKLRFSYDRDRYGNLVYPYDEGYPIGFVKDFKYFAWSPDSTRIAAVTKHGEIIVIPTFGSKPFKIGKSWTTERLSWSPDSKHIAIQGINRVGIVRAKTGKQVFIINGASRLGGWSPNGKHIVTYGEGEQWVNNNISIWTLDR
jgi:TolB-like protein